MSKIFHSGSGIQFKNVRFQDLESIGKEKDSFFVPASLPEKIKDADRIGSTPKKQEEKIPESPSEKPIDMEALKEEAYAKGKSDGFLEAEKKLHSAAQVFGTGLEQINCLRESLLAKSKEDLVRLIMAVAEKVIKSEIEEKEDLIVGTVSRALESAVQADEYYIKVNPEDLDIVCEKEPLFLARMKGLQHIHFIPDGSVSRGGCLAESKAGDVDATIETQLNEIITHLKKEILS